MLGEGGGGVEGPTVRHAAHVNLAVDLVQLLSQVVTVQLGANSSSRGPDHHDLTKEKYLNLILLGTHLTWSAEVIPVLLIRSAMTAWMMYLPGQ